MNLHILFPLLLALGFVRAPADATSFYIRPMSEFTKGAANIVKGRIHAPHVEPGTQENGNATIFTYAQFEVEEVLKGGISGKSILIRKIGGTLGDRSLYIPGSPDFPENRDTVLFLTGVKKDQSYEVTGLELGEFGTEEKDGVLHLTGGLLGLSRNPEEAEGASSGPSALEENRQPWPLTRLRALIRSQAGAQAESPAPNPGAPLPSTSLSASPSPSATAPAPLTPPAEGPASGEAKPSMPSPASSAGYWALGVGILLAGLLFWRRR
jgi:hypothetical protein